MTDEKRSEGSGRPRRSGGNHKGGRNQPPANGRGAGRGDDRNRPRGKKPTRDRDTSRQQRNEGHSGRAGESAQRRTEGPTLPEDVTAEQLESTTRAELRSLPRTLAEVIARHLVMVQEHLAENPELAYEHARAARAKASRVGVVREISGVAAYTVGKWQEALSELRAARRMTGRDTYLAVMADCERGLGRPERALEIAHGSEAEQLEAPERCELRIVAAGARWDLEQPEAALIELQGPELQERRARPWLARLFYAYAEALLHLGRTAQAREYFSRASAVDTENETDADERCAELEGLQIVDVGADVVWTDAEDPPAEQVADESPSPKG
ncbi:hypothetical protein RIF23_00005 [Lipingzhangella sp. LS1_29]|uniref:Tetratricopeptide repeat protein n=1 Tax=Lipingzhangella rawalii TaxID=2055835 RepID=A0ABU2H1I1_9ACTN|nr:hypothetical protein [Lipingzhangella rawalii]MDS1268670.1 hypothetical protein [Lipingzhangella rawalii]